MSSTELARLATAVAGEPKERSVRLRRYKAAENQSKARQGVLRAVLPAPVLSRVKLNHTTENLFQLAESKAAIEEAER